MNAGAGTSSERLDLPLLLLLLRLLLDRLSGSAGANGTVMVRSPRRVV